MFVCLKPNFSVEHSEISSESKTTFTSEDDEGTGFSVGTAVSHGMCGLLWSLINLQASKPRAGKK